MANQGASSSSTPKMDFPKNNIVALIDVDKAPSELKVVTEFVRGTPLFFALTANPKIYVEAVKEFWRTATISTNGDSITVTINGEHFTITSTTVTNDLQLPEGRYDELPTTE